MQLRIRFLPVAFIALLGLLAVPAMAQEEATKDKKEIKKSEKVQDEQDKDEKEKEEQEDEEVVFESFKELQADYDKQYNAYRRASITASRARDREKMMEARKLMPKFNDYAEQVMAFINEDPSTPAARKDMFWALTKAGTTKTGKQIQSLLLEHHIESKEIGTLISALSRSPGKATEKTLRSIVEKSPHDSVQANAIYSLIGYLEKTKSKADDEDEAQNEIDELFDTLKADFSEVEDARGVSYFARLEGQRFAAEKLQIGLPVPDIIGEDVDGVEFKLSDYKGKVVVIDFWGDW